MAPQTCVSCGAVFDSKNALFRHLRDLTSACTPPSVPTTDQNPDNGSCATLPDVPDAAVPSPGVDVYWGDIPQEFTKMDSLQALLRDLLQTCNTDATTIIQHPLVKRLERKGYGHAA